jgi:AraC-like DNA-binding protein
MPRRSLPLMAIGPYMPAIHSGDRNRGGLKVVDWRPDLIYGLFHIADGAARLHGPRAVQALATPCLVLLHPQQPQRLEVPAGSSWLSLRFDVLATPRVPVRKGAGSYMHAEPTRQPPPEEVWGIEMPKVLPEAVRESGRRMLEDCVAIYWRDPIAYAQANARLAGWLADLIARLAGKDALASLRVEPEDLSACRQAAAVHVDHGGTVNLLAERAGYTRQHFTRRFQAAHGKSPRQFAIEERMRLAGELLRTTRLSVRAVAENCGYASLSAFIRRFQQHHGSSPAEWRRLGD